MQVVRDWFKRYFNDPQVVILSAFLIIGFVTIIYLGKMLAPALAALVLAYLMEGMVGKLVRIKIPRFAAVTTVYLVFIAALVLIFGALMPRLFQQVEKFLIEIPRNVEKVQLKIEDVRDRHPDLFIKAESKERPDLMREFALQAELVRRREAEPAPSQNNVVVLSEDILKELANRLAPEILKQLQGEPMLLNTNVPSPPFLPLPDLPIPDPPGLETNTPPIEPGTELLPPDAEPAQEKEVATGFISERFVDDLIREMGIKIAKISGDLLGISLEVTTGLVMMLIYLILVPLMVLFFLKDKDHLLGWFRRYLPEDRALAAEVWADVDIQIGNYVRGKFLEILIVWAVTYVTFTVLELDYAMLLALFVGLSVLIPYIGATVMTIPIALIAFFQYGTTPSFWWVVGSYGIIQLLDGNVLAPLLLSEVTNLHPVAIIVAVLIFGGLFGFWGVFFAIPLATLVQAVLTAFTRRNRRHTFEGSETWEPGTP